MILMPQIFDVTANENARYKRNELEWLLNVTCSLSLLVFNVTCNEVSVIYVTPQMCRRIEEEVVPTVGLPTP